MARGGLVQESDVSRRLGRLREREQTRRRFVSSDRCYTTLQPTIPTRNFCPPTPLPYPPQTHTPRRRGPKHSRKVRTRGSDHTSPGCCFTNLGCSAGMLRQLNRCYSGGDSAQGCDCELVHCDIAILRKSESQSVDSCCFAYLSTSPHSQLPLRLTPPRNLALPSRTPLRLDADEEKGTSRGPDQQADATIAHCLM